MIGHIVRHFVSSIAIGRAIHIRGLIRRIVGQFVLEEVHTPTIGIPDHVVLLEVLDKQAVDGDILTIDDQASISRVDGPADTRTMISTPQPRIVNERFYPHAW